MALAFFIPSILAFAAGLTDVGWVLLFPAAINGAFASFHILNAWGDKQSENRRVKELDARLNARRQERERERQQRRQE